MHSVTPSASSRGTPSRRGKSPRLRAESPSEAGSSLPNFTKEPVATFTSSLKILVEGTTPIESDSDKDRTQPAPQPSTPNESQRAPRKSKTDALAALHSHVRSSTPNTGEEDPIMDDDENYRIPVAPRLDLSSVKTSSPRKIEDSSPRPFGLQDCPEYYPTVEEFKDPMGYIRSISEQAKEYGICKIIPPEGWDMPFVTDSETFRFRTRLQRLNSIEASARAKLNFLEQLYQYHKQQGNPRIAVPTINHKPLDLWLLRKEVQKMGGYEAVTREKKWADLGPILGYRGIPGLSTQIKQSYARVILPYDDFCEKSKNTPGISPIVHDPQLKTHQNIQMGGKTQSIKKKPSRLSSTTVKADESSPPSSPLTDTSSPLSEAPDDKEARDADGDHSRHRRNPRMGSVEQSSPRKSDTPVVPPPVFYDKPKVNITKGTNEQHCEICHKKNRGVEMLLCDGCDCGFHTFCLRPPLTSIPKDHWFCYTCLSGTGGDFGFEEGEEHSLPSFQARDKEFRRRWWRDHAPEQTASPVNDPKVTIIGDVPVSEYDVEREFWRLVQSTEETVEVEYGADVHSTTHGSAMPTMETHPLNPYSKDPWNLNNIPIVKDSLLRFIKSDISGMTVPWTYVGMAFSTFCWHNEDHYTYSINFMHWGETKTWYGIPGEDAEKFEAAIKCEAPDLFEAQPDLLFQLVTLMNPKRVTDAGVRVFACNQRPGEFVITFPKAYHAGFNHGFNFNEAVNFALPDWLSFGRECVARYREHRKMPVFSHDELLVTITQQSHSIKTATWLHESLQEMTERELASREKARAMGLAEVLQEEDRPDDQYQCTVCKTFCYLSFIMCSCTSNVACVDHADLLCEDRPSHQLVLRKRFSDRDLIDTQARFTDRASAPATWRNKLSKVLSECARPHIRHLRALLAEGDRINFPLPELLSLRRCVTKANEWIDAANTFTVRKQSRKRSRRPRGRQSLSEPAPLLDDPGDRPDRSLDDLYSLSKEVEDLGFDASEIGALANLAKEAEQMRERARDLLQTQPASENREAFLSECKRLLIDGSSINVILDELVEVERIVDREQLIKDLQETFEDADAPLSLEEVRQFLFRAQSCGLSSDHKHIRMLESRQRTGSTWEERGQNILSQPVKTIEELEDFADLDPAIPMDPALLARLMAARAKAKDFDKQARAWLEPESGAPKPRVIDVLRMVSRAEKDFSIPSVMDLKRTAEIAKDLETRCDHVLRNTFVPADDEDLFVTIGQWRTYAQNHLRMFVLPIFDKLNTQIKVHEQWIQEVPWYRDGQQHKSLYEDVMACTDPNDDYPTDDEYLTCICNSPVLPPDPGDVSDAVQCDHCFARFHGDCAKNGGSCPFCDHHHWNGAIRKDRNFHFCYLPQILSRAPDITRHYSEDWKHLEAIVHRVDRLSAVIGQFLAYASQADHQDPQYLYQVRHFMRKLYKIQFAVSPNPDISFGLDLAGLHRLLAGGKASAPRQKKKKRLRLTFGQDDDADWTDDLQVSEDTYVDLKRMLDTHSKDILYTKLPPPFAQTLFVELIDYGWGQNQFSRSSATTPRPESQGPRPVPAPPGPSHHHLQRPPPISRDRLSETSNASPGSKYPSAPPPWSYWNNGPPQEQPFPSQHRHGGSVPSPHQPQPSRKRKHLEDVSSPEGLSRVNSSSSSGPAPKRRPPVPPTQHSSPDPNAPARHVQTLSPSLAMIVSPVDHQVITSSPQPSYPPPLRNGPSGSPPTRQANKPLILP
ncbi:hypothetical protein H0H93_010808 [Arthromyces matolae]|nr:hypothetical protein H0H93_010808 [Arthromyces matolae]